MDTSTPEFRRLQASVRASGILVPLRVRRMANAELQVVDGMQRLLAAREVGLDTVPVVVSDETAAPPVTAPTESEALAAETRPRRRRPVDRAALAASIDGLERCNPDASARRLVTAPQRALGIAVIAILIWLGARSPQAAVIAVLLGITVAYAAWIAFRAYVLLQGTRPGGVEYVSPEELAALDDLPVYTVLSPLYREAAVLPQLLGALERLDYPKALLDVKLILEADDVETLSAVDARELPPYIDVVLVPAEGPRTKPKACNYALQFARGDCVVIFDAEDLPEPDQLLKAVCIQRRHGGRLGCVQAKLNYHNARQNILTGWFALEYTAWFDFFLPGLTRLGLPIPLGGTSNHFPRRLLLELGGWDPYNVTEDAELGMRLHRAGYRTAVVESTTWEEANSDFVNWMKQRSRWAKGYAVTWLVVTRHPVKLWRETGMRGLVGMQLLLGGAFATSVLNFPLWALTALWVCTRMAGVGALFPPAVYYLAMLEAVVGNFLFIYVNVLCATHRDQHALCRVALLSPLYWLMTGIAMVKAVVQMISNPTLWEKTTHGLSPGPTDDSHPPGLAPDASMGFVGRQLS